MWLTLFLAVALAVALFFLFFGPRQQRPSPRLEAELAEARKQLQKAEEQTERRRRDYDEQRAELNAAKEQLKAAKRKLYEEREAEKGPSGQSRARAQAEAMRELQAQLDQVHAERSHLESELQKLRSEAEISRRRPTPPKAPEPVVAKAEVPSPAPPVTKVIRELSPADKERMERLEQNAAHERKRMLEAEREQLKLKRKLDSQTRLNAMTKGELDLVKDKYKALEKRLNRTLLESDLLHRALRALEEKTGLAADRTRLTEEEAAASDRSVEAQQAQEAEAEARNEEATQLEAEPLPPEAHVSEAEPRVHG